MLKKGRPQVCPFFMDTGQDMPLTNTRFYLPLADEPVSLIAQVSSG
jgi:hypothetical protein